MLQKLSAILFALGLSASVLVPAASHAQNLGDSVKSGEPPYKPGRQITGDAPGAAENEGKGVKHSQPPYKPGRQLEGNASMESAAASWDEPGKPVKTAEPPYKPGREAEDK